jgi:hypothetical protein
MHGQYIYSLLMFVVKFKEIFSLNSDIRDRNTRYNLNLHFPATNLKFVQKGVFYSGVKIYNHPLVLNVVLESLSALRLN